MQSEHNILWLASRRRPYVVAAKAVGAHSHHDDATSQKTNLGGFCVSIAIRDSMDSVFKAGLAYPSRPMDAPALARWYDCEGNELAADDPRVESARFSAFLKIGEILGIRYEPKAPEMTLSERQEVEEIDRYLAESTHPLDLAFPDFARAVRTSRYDAEAVYLESLGLDERRRLFTELAKVRNRIGRHLLLCQASKALSEAFASNRTAADRRS